MTVTSSSVARIDQLQLAAFGESRSSSHAAAALPVRLALVPPDGVAPGMYPLTAIALLDGVQVGSGSTQLTVTSGRGTATLPIAANGTSGCQPPTPNACGAACVDLQSDPRNCKTCGNECNYPHAGSSCAQGACQIGACESGYADCINGPADGCETQLAIDPGNCGACGTRCLLGQLCNGGKCQDNIPTCQSPGVTCVKAGCTSGKFAVSAGGGIVVDLVNGRKLFTRATRGPATHGAAKADCLGLSLEGIAGWRLPYPYAELPQYMTGGLQGCPVCRPAVDQAAFPDTANITDGYWTDDYSMRYAGYLLVTYCDGRANYADAGTTPLPYRCVHDPLP